MVSLKPLQSYSEPLPGVDLTGLGGRLIVIVGPHAVGRSTQVARLRPWLEREGHAVFDTSKFRSALAGKSIQEAKGGHTMGPLAMTLFYATDFADRLEKEIIPALRAGFVVLTDHYTFSIMARGIARGQDRKWIEQAVGFALVPHAIFYLRARVGDLITRVVTGRGAFDYWESGMDYRFGADKHQSFVRYQRRVIQALDNLAGPYGFTTIDATQPPDAVFRELQQHIAALAFEKMDMEVTPAGKHSSRRTLAD
jgi:dTMP kinase